MGLSTIYFPSEDFFEVNTNQEICDCCFLVSATKMEQAYKFNDPSDECSVLVASDAIGMGLNL